MNHDDEKGYASVPTPGGDLRGAADHAGPASRGDKPTVAAVNLTVATGSRGETPTTGSDRGTTCPFVVGQPPMVVAQKATSVTETVTVAQQATVAEELEYLRAVTARCQGLVDWLARHSDLGVDIEADGIRRAIGDRLHTALRGGPPPEWERHGFPDVRGRCPACGNTRLFLGSGGYVTCPRVGCPNPDAASTLLERRPVKYPITSHAYQGERFLHPCTAVGYGSMCGATEYDHQEES